MYVPSHSFFAIKIDFSSKETPPYSSDMQTRVSFRWILSSGISSIFGIHSCEPPSVRRSFWSFDWNLGQAKPPQVPIAPPFHASWSHGGETPNLQISNDGASLPDATEDWQTIFAVSNIIPPSQAKFLQGRYSADWGKNRCPVPMLCIDNPWIFWWETSGIKQQNSWSHGVIDWTKLPKFPPPSFRMMENIGKQRGGIWF